MTAVFVLFTPASQPGLSYGLAEMSPGPLPNSSAPWFLSANLLRERIHQNPVPSFAIIVQEQDL